VKADRVIGCTRCGKPCALVDDEIPADELCPWCRAEDAPRVMQAYVSETQAQERKGRCRYCGGRPEPVPRDCASIHHSELCRGCAIDRLAIRDAERRIADRAPTGAEET